MEIPKMCRFCLTQEKDGIKIVSVFEFTGLSQNILNCTGLNLTSEDPIPPLICKKCFSIMEDFSVFLTTVKKSEEVLENMFANKIKNKQIQQTGSLDWSLVPKEYGEESDMKHDDFVDCISNSHNSLEDLNKSEIKCLDSVVRNETVVYFAGGKKIKLNESDDNDKKSMDQKLYSCTICAKSFDTFFEYHDHQECHNGQFVFCCSKCSEVFCNRNELVNHEKAHKVICQSCNVQVLPKSLTTHLKKHSDRYKCKNCDARHTSKAALEKHIKSRHAGVKGYVCYICGKQNSCQSSMKRHIAIHSSERPYKCKFCSFTAKSPAVLKVHTSRKHSTQKCICETCARTFKSEFSLKQHRKRIHNPKRYKCQICAKAFIEKYNLNKHITKRHAKQRIYDCQICHMEFFTVKQLKEHMYSHRLQCYNCPRCKKKFSYKKKLDKHLLICFGHERLKQIPLEVKTSMSMPNTSLNFNK